MGCLKIPYDQEEGTIKSSPLKICRDIEENPASSFFCIDYSPFGMTFNFYKRAMGNENRFLYNQGTGDVTFNTERVSDLGVDWDMTKYRLYDPALGRFLNVDPKANADNQYGWAPYHYAFDNPIRYNDPMGDCPPGVDCGSYWLGFGASVIDNVTMGLTGVRGAAASYAGDASSFNTGQDQGDVAMVAVGAAMIEGGTGAAAGGAVVTVGSGGLAAPVSGTIAVGGVVTAVAGGALVGKAAASLASRNGRVNVGGSFGGKQDTKSKTANESLRKAKEQNGIPRSQQPDKTIKPNTPEGDAAGLDGRNVKQYEYTNSRGKKVTIRQDKPANYNQGSKGDQGPHFNGGQSGNKLKQHHYYDFYNQ